MFFTTALKKDQCLWISYKGQSPIKEMMSARYATHKYLAQKHWSRIVVDITALSPMPTAMEVIHLASDVSGELPPDTRVALLVNPEQTEYAKLAECVSRIEGVQFHFFFNREEAKAWVKASPQEKPAPAEKSNNPNPLPCSTLRRQSPKLLALPLAFALFACGCAHYPVNAPLPTVNPATGYRFETAVVSTNSDDTSVILAFSGGGTRAAALSYGVLQELAQTEVGPPNHEHRLLDDVTMVSGVSGGSITAAYYTLWGDRIFSDYESQFLKKHVQAGLFLRLLCPWNLARLTSPRFCSSDLAAEYYDDLLFKGATYADLTPRPGRPFLLVNATDLAIGARFEFSQDQFDLLHSDLSPFPISRAVAASAAFPLYFAPLVLKNYPAQNPATEPAWIQSALSNPQARSRLKNLALQQRSYIDSNRRQFIHLVDGGITDNLGLRGPVDRAIELEESGTQVAARIQRRLVMIVVDASAEHDYGWNTRDRTLGLGTVMGSVAQITGNRYSFETIELFKEVSARLDRERQLVRRVSLNSPSGKIETYMVELHFDQMADESDRRFFNTVPTTLQLKPAVVDRLTRLARQELRNNPDFRKLVEELRSPDASPDEHPAAAKIFVQQ